MSDSTQSPAQQLSGLWAAGQGPDVRQFLHEVGPLDPARLVAVLRVDQRERWRRGQQVPAEQYLHRFPALEADPERALEVVYGEFLLREGLGEVPALEDYQQRFPQYAERLRQQVEVHQALEGDDGLRPGQPDPGWDRPSRTAVAPGPPPGGSTVWPIVPGYEILAELGRGGMGVVYKARQVGLKRLVALKMILAGPHAGAAESARFRAEAGAVARFQHPNIVQIFEVGEHRGLPFFSLEYCPGGSLAAVLTGGPLPPMKAANLVEVLALAMEAAHEQHIIHRDLKPANILLAVDGTPKVTDFGLAKKLDEVGQTLSGQILGTPTYMAPEQAAGRTGEVGPSADVYALGAILYECLIGRPPFRGETWQETIFKVLSEEPLPPTRERPDLPLDLEAICLKCLEKDSHQRYVSAKALAEDLQRFQTGEPVAAVLMEPVERLARWANRAGYELLGEVARAGMAIIYKARQSSLKRLVALKMVRTLSETGEERARMQAEAEAIAQLQHPNIVQIHDVVLLNNLLCLVMEYAEGGDLRIKLGGKPQVPREAAQLVETLARAIHHAHQRGIIHRDLKPANVLLSGEGVPKVTDFGLVKRLGDSETDGLLVGTPSYMAPEQASGKPNETTAAVDVYGLGAILYECLSGQPPFKAKTNIDTICLVIHQQPAPLSRLQRTVPPVLEAICLKCLRKEPGDRYESAEQLAEDLRQFLTGKRTMARPPSLRERYGDWAQHHPDVARAAMIGIALLLISAATGAALSLLTLLLQR